MDNVKREALREIFSKQHYFKLAKENRQKYFFSGQNSNEIVFALFRQAPIRNLPWMIRGVIGILFPFLIPYLFYISNNVFFVEIYLSPFYWTILYITYYSIFMSWIVIKFTDWFFDVYIITNERFIEIIFKPFGNLLVKEIWLEDIDVVKTNTSGVLGAIFNYGNLKIVTRSDDGGTELMYIGYFTERKNILSDLSKIARKYKSSEND